MSKEEFDPNKDKIIQDIETFLKLPLEDKTGRNKNLDECKHMKVYLDDENCTVECQQCGKKLSPFWYLKLLAREWKIRRYQDAEAIYAYRKLEEQRLNALARGKCFVRPVDGDGQKCWDSYEALHGHLPEYVYYSGGWYAGEKGSSELFAFIQMQLARRQK